MSRSTRLAVKAGLVSAAVLAACRPDRPVSPAEIEVIESGTVTPATRMSRLGRALDTTLLRPIQLRVTRALARALGDAGTRQRLYALLHASPYREHKLHLSELLRGDGGFLLDAMATQDGRPAGRVLAALDSLVDFEIYLPVPEHWSGWTGGDDLIVASDLAQSETPIAFDLSGRRVAGMSRDVPPATPTLVLVPVETDFSTAAGPAGATCVGCPPPCSGTSCDGGGGSGGGAPPPDVFRLSGIRIDDAHEPWSSGAPEFELYVWAADANGDPLLHNIVDPNSQFYNIITTAIAADCISQYFPASSPKYWDFDAIGVYSLFKPAREIYVNRYPDSTSQYRWDLVLTENDDADHCPYSLPSIGNPNIIFNDDDLVGRITLKGGFGPRDFTNVGDIARITLSYGP